MWALALRTTRDPEMASDAVQDAFLNAFRRAGSFRGEAQVTTWLHRITVNASLDRLRRVRPTSDIADHDPVEPRDRHHSVDVRLDVRAALEQLPEGQRLALTLVDMHGLSVAEAAQVLEVAEGTIKSRCSRGREAMARILRLDGAPEEPRV
jgi:RNA polymerase sigma-70 factor (ECF subfamily)